MVIACRSSGLILKRPIPCDRPLKIQPKKSACKSRKQIVIYSYLILQCDNECSEFLMSWPITSNCSYKAKLYLASHADILLARHALLPEPKECLRGRLNYTVSLLSSPRFSESQVFASGHRV